MHQVGRATLDCPGHYYTQRATFEGETWPILNEQRRCDGVRRPVATDNHAAPGRYGVVNSVRDIPTNGGVAERQRNTVIPAYLPKRRHVPVSPTHGRTDPAGAYATGPTHQSIAVP